MRAVRWALAIGIAAVAIVLATQLGSAPYVVRAEFRDVNGLRTDFHVREQGVVVGTVGRVEITPRDTAMVTMNLDHSAAPIGDGASASIHPSNLLGEKYVQLDPGNVSHPQGSGTTIPITRTSVSPELDQVLNTFDANTRVTTGVFLTEEGNALLGRGGDLAATLKALPPSLDSARQLVAGLATNNVALRRLIDQSDAILADAEPKRAALGRLITSADGMFATLASRQRSLGDTIAQAPPAFAQLHRTLVELANAAPPLGQAAAGLQATAPSLTQTLRALPGFARAAEPTLRTLIATAPALARLGTRATPVVHALEPTAARLADFSTALAPISNILKHDIGGILAVIQGWARAIADRDGVGHIYRIEVLVPNNVITSLAGSLPPAPSGAQLGNPSLPLRSSARHPGAPGPSGSRAAKGAPVAVPRALGTANGHAVASGSGGGSASGGAPASTSQLAPLLHYLVGP